MSLFDEFGFDFGTVVNEAEQVKEKAEKKNTKSEKKVVKKTPAKKSVKDPEAEEKLSLPVTVKMPYKTLLVEGSSETTVKDILEEVFQKGFKEIALLNQTVKDNTLYIGPGVITTADRRCVVNLQHPVEICIGELRCEYNLSHFNGEEEVTLEEVTEKFIGENPKFSTAEWLYDPEINVITPIFKGFPDKTMEKDAVKQGIESISVFGNRTGLSENGETAIKNLPEEIGADFTYYFGQVDKTLLATLKLPVKASSVTIRDDWKVNRGAKKETAAEKYKLPMKIWLYNFNMEREVTPADFGGKGKVTGDDIRDYLKKDIAAFADTGRSFDFIYSKTQNTLSVGINSGKKGTYASAGTSVWDDVWEEKEYFEDGPCYIYRLCPMCAKRHRIALSATEYVEFDTGYSKGESVIKIFPEMNKYEREFLISGYCPKCQTLLFGADIPKNLRIGRA